jgi:hypothetical protein
MEEARHGGGVQEEANDGGGMMEELCYKEHVALRQELNNLKNCQVTFLTFSVTATGVLLGLGTKLSSKSPPYAGAFCLFPLVILIPAWWIFFDKATTITRIVGYYRVLEKAILCPHSVKRFVGWETALGVFRKKQERDPRLPLWEQTKRLGKLIGFSLKLALSETTHRYWLITYYTFYGLSVVCVLLSLCFVVYLHFTKPTGSVTGVVLGLLPSGIAAIVTLISAAHNADVVNELIQGRNSYDRNEELWKEVLGVYAR